MHRRNFIAGLVLAAIAPLRAFGDQLDMFGPPCKPKAPPPKRPVATQHYKPVYNVEGIWNPSNEFLAAHLRNVHRINPAGMSRDQMFISHDRAHGVRATAFAPPPVKYAAPRRVMRARSTCPGGVCPLN